MKKDLVVLFDMDGTLVDSEPLHDISRRAFLRSLGIPEDYSQNAIGYSKSVFWAKAIEDYHLQKAPQTLAKEEFDALLTYVKEHGISVFPGISETLVALKAEQIPTAVVSSSLRSFVEPVLTMTGLSGYFDLIVTVDEVKAPKPAPEIYQLALQKLDATPAQGVAVEDSRTGARAAKAAGLYCIGFAPPNTIEAQDLSCADIVIDTMTKLYETIRIAR